MRSGRKHDLPAPEGAGKRGLVARDDETGFTSLLLLARAQRHEVPIAVEHPLDLGGISLAVDFALALLGDHEDGRQAVLKRPGIDRHAQFLECFRHEHLRRIRLAMICFPKVADMAVLGAETSDLRLLLRVGHAVPLGIDIDSHTMISDEG